LEYIGLRFGLLIIDFLPFNVTARIAGGLAALWYRLDGRRRRIALENIARSGIAADPRDAARIARGSFRHLLLVVLESLGTSRFFDEANWRERVAVEIPEDTRALIESPEQGIILVSGHLGNWEVAAQLVSYLKPVTGITRAMNNPLAERLFRERKPRNRFTLTPKHDAKSGRLFEVLKKGDVLALLVDQHARQRGMRIDFFGVPASTHTSHALLHLVTRTPLVFGYCVRVPPGPMTFKLVAGPPLRHTPTGDREADIRAILDALGRQLEDAIRAYPEQYLWVHRRWRDHYVKQNRPAGEPRQTAGK
jgi:KDO2-lipid IV(A) lauroyltransferase